MASIMAKITFMISRVERGSKAVVCCSVVSV